MKIKDDYKSRKKELSLQLEKNAQQLLYGEYRRIMGETYSTLDELWKAFDEIEKAVIDKVKIPNKGTILHNFEKTKLRLMAEQITKNIQSQNIQSEQTKQLEIENLTTIIVPILITKSRR